MPDLIKTAQITGVENAKRSKSSHAKVLTSECSQAWVLTIFKPA